MKSESKIKTVSPSPENRTAATALAPPASLSYLRREAAGCHACDLWRNATQTVFGEGSPKATVMLVGEQPGDYEDRAGHPFVGPAGRVLDEALREAGIDRNEVYVTNVVKHFKWAPAQRGKRRIHKKPRQLEIHACRPWLDAELRLVKPQVLVCLGATAAQALLGGKFTCSFGAADVSRYTVLGTKGMLEMDPAYEYSQGLQQRVTVGGKTRSRKFPKRDQFAAELAYFSDCVLKNQDPEPSGLEGLADVRIVQAIYESARTGRIVALPELPPKERPTARQEIRRPAHGMPETVDVESPSGEAA